MAKSGSSKSARAFMWVSVLVLVAGVIAFATVKIGGSGSSSQAASGSGSQADALPEGSSFTPEAPKPAPVPKEAQEVAGEFILAAAGRENLKKAWTLAHPDMKRDCDCTYKQWLTGNIPVVYYPTKGLKGASFAVDESTARRVVLQVALDPADNAGVEPQAFYIGLRAVGQGEKLHWLVDYWAPISATPIPQLG